MTDTAPAVADVLADWVEQMRADPASAGAPPSLEHVVAGLAGADPALASVARYMALSRQLADADQQVDELVESEEPEDSAPAAGRGQARERLAEVLDELDVLRARNLSLAAALGACYRCWGDDRGCEVCAGGGTPGGRRPHLRLFDFWITPAIRAVQTARRSQPTAPTEGAPA